MLNEHREDPDNIVIICKECSEKLYPNKGLFGRYDLLGCTHVKKKFGREHMWVKISEITDDGVTGLVDNDPICEDSPRCGEKVHVKFVEIEDIYPKDEDWR